MSVNGMAADEIRAIVLSGAVAPGDRVAELPLAARLGISRPSVREALRRLESRGLLVADGGRGLCVVRLSPDELRSTVRTRGALETLHAGLAARRVREGAVAPAELRHLEALARTAARRAPVRRGGLAGDRAFHQAIDGLADSPVSARLLDVLWDQLVVAGPRVALDAAAAATATAEHRGIVEAIAAGRPRRAREAADRHVRALVAHLAAADAAATPDGPERSTAG
jgi:DNA-binding GntR family transcriptional regulator